MTTQTDILDMFRSSGALLDGHFRLTSGKHSGQYFQCARVLQYPAHAGALCRAIADHYRPATISLVIAPAIGGIVVGQETGRQLGVRTIFAERENGVMSMRRGFEIFPEDRILICEDVITTGGSVKEVMELIKPMGGTLVGIGSIVDRSNGKADFGIPYFSVMTLDAIAWQPEACPLCKTNLPLVKPGSRVFQ